MRWLTNNVDQAKFVTPILESSRAVRELTLTDQQSALKETPAPTLAEEELSDCFAVNVLIVEDDPADLAYVTSLLNENLTITWADSAKDAIQHCHKTPPDCVFVDYQLPQMDGICLIVELRKNPQMRYVPIIMLTSHGTPESAADAFKSGADDHLNKATLTRDLLDRVIHHTHRSKRLAEAIDAERHALVQENHELSRRHQLFSEYWTDVSHHLLNSVSSVHEFVSILMDELPGPINEEQGKCLALARGSCVDICRDIEKVVGITQLATDPGKMVWSPQDLNIVIAQVLDEVGLEAHADNIDLVSTLEPNTHVFTDRYVLAQLIYTITQKALRMSPKDGEVLIYSKADRQGKISVIVRARVDEFTLSDFEEEIFEYPIQRALKSANATDFSINTIAGVGIEFKFDLIIYQTVHREVA